MMTKDLSKHFLEALLLATVGFGIGLTINQLRDKPLGLVYESKELRLEHAVSHLTAESPPQAAKSHLQLPEIVTMEELQEFMEKKRGRVFDARPEIFHRLGHIPGAFSLPREDFENAYKTFQGELEADRAQPLVVYCSSSSCEDSTLVQKSLRALGYTNVAVFSGGWSEWQEKGMPEETKQ